MTVLATTPGVYLEARSPALPPLLETGVPVFLGRIAAAGQGLVPLDARGVAAIDYAAWSALERVAGTRWALGVLGFAVRGFFENGGRRCYVVAFGAGGLDAALAVLDGVDDFDLVSAPDSAGVAADQIKILDCCDRRTDGFAVLDAPGARLPDASVTPGVVQAAPSLLPRRANGALYAPWIMVREACPTCGGTGVLAGAPCGSCAGTGQGFVPPSGHVAGVYARTDADKGVQKAPANEVVEGALDLLLTLPGDAGPLNALRAFPGGGIRVFGARTLAAEGTAFDYVNARRVYLAVARWLEVSLAAVAFEPNDVRLWARIGRQVGAFLDDLYHHGALYGASADEAFNVKCDAETNPPELRDAGQVVTEVSLALARPNEFVKVRLVSSADGVSVTP